VTKWHTFFRTREEQKCKRQICIVSLFI